MKPLLATGIRNATPPSRRLRVIVRSGGAAGQCQIGTNRDLNGIAAMIAARRRHPRPADPPSGNRAAV